MAIPTVSPLPPAPQRAEGQEAFNDKSDPFIAAMPPLVTQINAVVAAVNAYAPSIDGAAASAAQASSAAQTATAAANAQLAAANLSLFGNPGDSVQVNAARNGLVFGPSDGQVGDIRIGLTPPNELWFPANAAIRAQSSAPTLFAALGLVGGQPGQNYTVIATGNAGTSIDIGSRLRSDGVTVMAMLRSTLVNFSFDGGATWTTDAASTAHGIPNPSSITWDEFNQTWVITSSTGTNLALSSNDGTAWRYSEIVGPVAGATKIQCDSNGVWILVPAATSTTLWRSTDAGVTWTATGVTGATAVHTAIATDNKGTWIATAAATIRRSVDGGLTWTSAQVTAGVQSAISTDKQGVWLSSGLTSNSNTYKSVDNGQTWTLLITPVTSSVTDIAYSLGFFFLVRSVSPQLIMISSAADATVYTVPAAAVLATLVRITATNGFIGAVGTSGASMLRSIPTFGYDTTSQFKLPDFPLAQGLKAWIKAGLINPWVLGLGIVGTVSTFTPAAIANDDNGTVIAVGTIIQRKQSDTQYGFTTVTGNNTAALTIITGDGNKNWLAANGTEILRSSDNGATFAKIAFTGISGAITELVLGKNGVALARAGTLYKSVDYGLTWVPVGITAGKIATNCAGLWIVAAGTATQRSIDNGVTWAAGGILGGGVTNALNIAIQRNGQTVAITGTSGIAISVSTNGGASYLVRITKIGATNYTVSTVGVSTFGELMVGTTGPSSIPLLLSFDGGASFSVGPGGDGVYRLFAPGGYTPSVLINGTVNLYASQKRQLR